MATTWTQQAKRSSSGVSRNYNVSGLNYNVTGILYQGAYDSTVWTFINKTS